LGQVILTKRQNFKLWVSGGLGNRLRVWSSLAELEVDGFQGLVSLRYLGSVGGQWCFYDLPVSELRGKVDLMLSEGADTSRIMFNEGGPDDAVVIQGELWNGMDRPYWFRFSREKLKMRDALKASSETSQGLQSLNLLRSAMTASSWADFEVLLDRYPDHAFEVSVYNRCVGDIPGRNTLVWEVRRY
jgi:hypothetical protein